MCDPETAWKEFVRKALVRDTAYDICKMLSDRLVTDKEFCLIADRVKRLRNLEKELDGQKDN